ncbi:MAG: methyltransferase domain-containing protein [Thermodesulfobacteriota bacterium]
MWEQSKAAKRRFGIPAFHNRYFVGHGIDVGGKPDPLGQYAGMFARMLSARTWDMEDGDAQQMAGVPDNQFDFLHASHCLEHMVDVGAALGNWIRIVRPGGFLIITVPDEDLYEQGQWPSRYNPDHKWTFTVMKQTSWSPRSINVLELLHAFAGLAEIEKIELLRDFYRDGWVAEKIDQTLTPVAECAIEIVLRKR